MLPPPRLRVAALACLLAGSAALLWPPRPASDERTWSALLAPYSQGAPVADGFRIDSVRLGEARDLVLSLQRDGDPAAVVEVHLLPRGVWTGIRESASFGIGYETARSPAAQREAVTEALAQAIRRRDPGGLPAPAAIPLGADFAVGDAPWPRPLRGWNGALLVACLALLAALARRAAPGLAVAGLVLGGAALVGRALGVLPAAPAPGPSGGAIELLDPTTRLLQLAWLLLIGSAPWGVWRVARVLDLRAAHLLGAVGLATGLALAATWTAPDAPLHANGHAWREAREVLVPWGARANGAAPYVHGRAGAPLQWLLAGAERTLRGRADPLAISRVTAAAAAGGAALLTAVLTRSPGAGLAAGAALALMPLERALAVSGSALGIAAWLLPWSLALLLAAARGGQRTVERGLLAAAALTAALGTLSHTALLAWPPALAAAWLIAARRALRWRGAAWAALLLVGLAWLAQVLHVRAMLLSRDQEAQLGLAGAAWLGVTQRNLFLEPAWTSPLLLALLAAWILLGMWRVWRAPVAASAVALLIVAPPFFAVTACSSDALRYQGALLPLAVALAVAGLWALPFAAELGRAGRALLRGAGLAGLVLLPRGGLPGIDPMVAEHQLAAAAAPRIAPGTLIVLPPSRLADGRILADFPDFLLPDGVQVAFAGDPAIAAHRGPRLRYLGLACISWPSAAALPVPPALRPECEALRGDAHPWQVRALPAAELPRLPNGGVWTFHHLAAGVPFGFFADADRRIGDVGSE